MKNIPYKLIQVDFLGLLEQQFFGVFDLLYLPIDF